jgi:hypothetical protein
LGQRGRGFILRCCKHALLEHPVDLRLINACVHGRCTRPTVQHRAGVAEAAAGRPRHQWGPSGVCGVRLALAHTRRQPPPGAATPRGGSSSAGPGVRRAGCRPLTWCCWRHAHGPGVRQPVGRACLMVVVVAVAHDQLAAVQHARVAVAHCGLGRVPCRSASGLRVQNLRPCMDIDKVRPGPSKGFGLAAAPTRVVKQCLVRAFLQAQNSTCAAN